LFPPITPFCFICLYCHLPSFYAFPYSPLDFEKYKEKSFFF
jgi:hypothetical protein